MARENGVKSEILDDILLAQIEHHRAEVFYNLDPMRFPSDFIRRLPGCVKRTLCWRAAPSGNLDLRSYDLVICNFLSILDDWRSRGCQVAYFAPAVDPRMADYAERRGNELDLIFFGGYSRHHSKRARMLEAAASVPGIKARFHLEQSRLTRLANALPFVPLLRSHSYPPSIRSIRSEPLYGMHVYGALAKARTVLNGAIDMAGEDRGNMRCFETLGCGAVLLTDAGRYPDGFIDGQTMITYRSEDQLKEMITRITRDPDWAASIADAGLAMVRDIYSKDAQWTKFKSLL